MTRHSFAALARGTVTVIAGGVVLYAFGRYLGWWTIALVLAGAAWGSLVDWRFMRWVWRTA